MFLVVLLDVVQEFLALHNLHIRRQAIINLHIEGLIEYLDNEDPKAFR